MTPKDEPGEGMSVPAAIAVENTILFELLQAPACAASRGDVYVDSAITRALLQQPVTTESRREATPTGRSPICSGFRCAPSKAIVPT